MKTKSMLLSEIQKGGRIGEETVIAALTATALTNRGGSQLVKDGNTDEAIFKVTEQHLYAFIPLADKHESVWIMFERGNVSMLRDGVAGFMANAKSFGAAPNSQKLGTVQHVVDGDEMQFCDIARGGTDTGNTNNEGSFANGKRLAIRWIHLVDTDDAAQLENATHAMLTQPEDKPNVFGTDGDVSTILWVNGKVINPEDLPIEEE